MANILQDKGYTVIAVDNGSKALFSAGENPPDLILIEIATTKMTGNEISTILNRDEYTEHVPVIAVSLSGEENDKAQAFSVGCVYIISGPFQADEVLARVTTHLSVHQLKQKLEALHRKLHEEMQKCILLGSERKEHRKHSIKQGDTAEAELRSTKKTC